MRIAVMMLNLGGPRRQDEVRPFLRNLFMDREIIRLPGGKIGQALLSRLIAWRKAPSSAANYQQIGGGSPLVRWTAMQGKGMKRWAEGKSRFEVIPLPCMRYWHPDSETSLRAAQKAGVEHIVAFSQYPQESTTTSGSSIRNLQLTAERLGIDIPITTLTGWHEHPQYLEAVAECVREGVKKVPEEERSQCKILYSAHSLPMKFVDEGDPYPDQIRATVRGVQARTGLDLEHELAWQSKVGPIRWLSPATVDRICSLPSEGFRTVVVVPVAFVNDHIETLHELDIEVAEEAAEAGIQRYVRAPSLNTRPKFLQALGEVLLDHLATHRLEPATAPIA